MSWMKLVVIITMPSQKCIMFWMDVLNVGKKIVANQKLHQDT